MISGSPDIYDSYENKSPEEIPDEIQEMLEIIKIERAQRIEKLGKLVADTRDEAIKSRKQSGIEEIWREDEEYYQGIDDANRNSTAWLKSAGTEGGLSRSSQKSETGKCTAFFNITAQFVDSAASRMGDILLPSGDWNFKISPTPAKDEDKTQQVKAVVMTAFADVPAAQDDSKAVSEEDKKISDTVEKAETRIRDWLTECSYHAEVRKVIDSCAKTGTGILKGPVPNEISAIKVTEKGNEKVVDFEKRTEPASKYVRNWDFFWDHSCGDNIHNGNYVIELDRMTAKGLRELKALPGYQSDGIDKVLEEGPGKKLYEDGIRKDNSTIEESDLYEVWYYYGNVSIDDLQALKVTTGSKQGDVPAIVTLVNDTPIKACLNPLDVGGFPYDMIPWQKVDGSPAGVGIARKGRVPQEMLNASARAMMENAGLSAGIQLILKPTLIRPIDGQWRVTKDKVWIATEKADNVSLKDAILAIKIPSVQAELSAMIQMAYKMMEDATGIAYLMQGQQGSAPDTVGGLELLNRNASSVLRRLARTFDEYITEPHIRRYYSFLLQYGEDDEKSEMVIEAIGSSALVEREIQAIETQQLLQASLNPAFELSPAKTMEELLKIKRMTPSKFQMDDDEKNKPPGTAPAIAVAQIKAESDKAIADEKIKSDQTIAQLRSEVEHYKTQVNAAIKKHNIDTRVSLDAEYNQSLTERDKTNAGIQMQELQVKRELAILEYANQNKQSLDQVKKDLAINAQKLSVERELSVASLQLEKETNDAKLMQDTHKHLTKLRSTEIMTPPVEVAGRAPNGQSFER